MLLEKCDDDLQRFGRKLFAVVEELTGTEPELLQSGDWYRAEIHGRPFLYLRFIGAGARTYPANSVHLSAPWDERLAEEGVRTGNNWYGSKPSADLVVRPGQQAEEASAQRFLRNALQLSAN